MNEILEEYKKQFIIVLETVGNIQNNASFKKVESIISEKVGDNEETLLEQNAPFGVFVVLYMSFVLADLYTPDEVSSWENVCARKECKNLYNNYLKEITDNFTRKVSLEQVDLSRIRFVFNIV